MRAPRARDRRRARRATRRPLDADEVERGAARSSPGSRTTTSPSSATASTSSSTATAAELALVSVAGSGLGILRQSSGEASSRGFDALPPARASARARAVPAQPHQGQLARDGAPPGVPRLRRRQALRRRRRASSASGASSASTRTTAYHASPREIPILRRKVDAVLARAAFPADSHNEKALIEILETYPRDELFQIVGRRAVRDRDGDPPPRRAPARAAVRAPRHLRPLPVLPRVRAARPLQHREPAAHRAHPQVGRSTRLEHRLHDARVGVGARAPALHRLRRTRTALPEIDERKIETRLVAATRSWADDLEEALVDEHGEERGSALYRRYARGLPGRLPRRLGRRAPRWPTSAASRRSSEDEDLALSLYRPLEAPHGALRAKLFRAGAAARALRRAAAVREHGREGRRRAALRGHAARPRAPVWIYDFGLTYAGRRDSRPTRCASAFQDAFIRAWRGDAENDGYNRLVLRAGLTWREVTVLRAIARYLRQAGTTFSDRYVEHALVAHPQVARLLRRARSRALRPRRRRRRRRRRAARASEIEEQIDAVESLDQDRILRSFLGVVRAMLRTNYFQRDPSGARKPYLSFKLDPSRLAVAAAAAPALRDLRLLAARSRACTCAAARSRAAASAGRTGARTSAPRSSA